MEIGGGRCVPVTEPPVLGRSACALLSCPLLSPASDGHRWNVQPRGGTSRLLGGSSSKGNTLSALGTCTGEEEKEEGEGRRRERSP